MNNLYSTTFKIGVKTFQATKETEHFTIIDHLSRMVFTEILNSDGSEVLLTAENPQDKLAAYFEKRPGIVNDGIQSMRDYIQMKCNDMILAVSRSGEGKMNKVDLFTPTHEAIRTYTCMKCNGKFQDISHKLFCNSCMKKNTIEDEGE